MEQYQNQQQQVALPVELQMMKLEQEAKFALTPVGQVVRNFEVTQRIAKMYATSNLVPQAYQGNIGNCCIAIDMAMRMNANTLMVMQNLTIVHGQPSFSSKFLIATINASGKFTPLRYDVDDEEHPTKCRCYAYEASDKEHTERLNGTWITLDMAKKEGWSTKNGSKWQTMPEQMLKYRAAAFWQRIYCPEISMGFLTTEEAIDIAEVVEEKKPNRWDFVNESKKPVDDATVEVAVEERPANVDEDGVISEEPATGATPITENPTIFG